MPNVSNQINEARKVLQSLLEMSHLLCTGLDPETLTVCIRLCEAGVNPDVLTMIIQELRKVLASSGNTYNINYNY